MVFNLETRGPEDSSAGKEASINAEFIPGAYSKELGAVEICDPSTLVESGRAEELSGSSLVSQLVIVPDSLNNDPLNQPLKAVLSLPQCPSTHQSFKKLHRGLGI